MGGFLTALTDEQKKEVLNGLSWWVRAGSGVFDGNGGRFYSLANDLTRLANTDAGSSDQDIMFQAINHPIGQATEAVLKWWSGRASNGVALLEGEVREFLTRICDVTVGPFRKGRVVLSQSIAWLHRVDPEWTKSHLVPLFDWSVSREEASACWTGFLYSPKRIPALLAVLKGPFLETSTHLEDLSDNCREAYARFFTFVALEPAGVFSQEDIRSGFACFKLGDLENAARALSDVMEGAGEKSEVFWRETVRRFIEKIWPKAADRKSGNVSGHFAAVCIASTDEFPNAVEVLLPYFQATDWPVILLDKLKEKNLHQRFPREALDLAYRIVGESRQYPPRELEEILREIGEANPRLKELNAFKKLRGLYE
jgi:hypothetical protein